MQALIIQIADLMIRRESTSGATRRAYDDLIARLTARLNGGE